MAYIETVPEGEASGKLGEFYEADRRTNGYVANYTQAMSLNVDAVAAWRQLVQAIRSRMRLRRYELVTFAVAFALRCRY